MNAAVDPKKLIKGATGDWEMVIGLELLAAGPGPSERAWQEYCQVLLCANELVYVD